MTLDRLSQITEVGIKSGITLNGINVIGVVTATSLTVNGGAVVNGVVTATSFSGNVTGNITPTGLVVSGVSTFQASSFWGDGDIAYFGDGQDLLIWHNSTDSIIRDNGTGDLNIEGGNRIKLTNPTGIETYAVFNQDGASELWYDNVKRLETTNAGVTVTGTVGVGTALVVTGNARVTGILTVGTSSITLDGANDRITVGPSFISATSVGLGQTTTTGRNAGVGTATGTLIYNSSTQQLEFWNGTSWVASSANQFIQATGGAITDYTSNGVQFRAHSFTSSGTLTVNAAPVSSNTVEYLVVAGGGGGGNGPSVGGGGGGSGGVRLGNGFPITIGSYAVTVGGGGGQSTNGSASSLVNSINPPNSIPATGGGCGGGFHAGQSAPFPGVIGAPGGSGGGGGAYSTAGSVGPGGTGNTGGPYAGDPEGNPGGVGLHNPGSYAAFGGGGGYSGPGYNYVAPGSSGNASGGAGGNGIPTSISGTTTNYGGGGGGGGHPPGGGVGGTGGTGGGGNGGGPGAATAGSTNTGGGGGGAYHPASNSAASGGSGIVIIRYQLGQLSTKATGGTVSYSGGKTIHTFTASGNFTVSDPTLTSVEVLQVAGGGSGGSRDTSLAGGGGGGAGGITYSSSAPVTVQNYTIVVGAGAAPAGSPTSSGIQGANTSGVITTAVGGGYGGAYMAGPGGPGGSGGGAGRDGTATGGGGTPGQGNNGGASPSSPSGTGGGGGNSGVGGSGGGPAGGAGGNGTAYSISGASVTYAGGGGGSSYSGAYPNNGGPGGGGKGATENVYQPAVPGTVNSGGGGGGGGFPTGKGGSGIVIISYPS